MKRDGVEARAPRGITLGESGWWLSQMLRAVPPSVWSQTWNKSADELLEIAAEGDWRELLHQAWVTAAFRHREEDWAFALLKIYPHHTQLLEAVSPDRREGLMLSLIQSQPKEGMTMAMGYHRPWSRSLTHLVLSNLRSYYLLKGTLYLPPLRQDFLSTGLYMHPESIPEAAKLRGVDDSGSAMEQAIESLLHLLEFRRQMREELRP